MILNIKLAISIYFLFSIQPLLAPPTHTLEQPVQIHEN